MKSFITCQCGEMLLKSDDDAVKLRSKIIIFKNNNAYAICKKCSREHKIPISLNRELLFSKTKNPKLYVR